MLRLIDTVTLALTQHFDNNIPVYTILSHTWDDGEVTFQEMQNPTPEIKRKPGYDKIKRSANIARGLGFSYIWVDTCCINKESSAELTEAINSMYQCYQKAQICFVYLLDVPSNENPHPVDSRFRKSRWFTRGWTLQELLAPLSVVFYAKDWIEIGTKSSLQDAITDITGVPTNVLLVNYGGEISVAQRISWAAKRQTTRVEDIAYCLMGLLGIYMPILYGEGMNAFTRLQREIMKTSDDQTVFAWKSAHSGVGGLIANSPSDFGDSAAVERHDYTKTKLPYTVLNQGLRIELPLIPQPSMPNIFLAILNCRSATNDCPLGIYLKKEEDGQYVRVQLEHIVLARGVTIPKQAAEIYIRESDPVKFDVGSWMHYSSRYTFHVRGVPMPDAMGFALRDIYPPKSWIRRSNVKDSEDSNLFFVEHSGTSMATKFVHNKTGEAFVVMLGIHNWQVWTDIVLNTGNDSLEQIRNTYYTSGGRDAQRDACMDRVSRTLKDGRLATVEVGKRQYGTDFNNEVQYTASFGVYSPKPGRPATGDGSTHSGPPRYVYAVTAHLPPNSGFVITEALPHDFWSGDGTSRRLSMSNSGTSGIAMFENRNTKEKFAVMLGVHNYRPWMDIVTRFGNESAESIRGSYYRDDGRGGKLWENLTFTQAKLSGGRTASAKTRESQFLGEAGFTTDINVV